MLYKNIQKLGEINQKEMHFSQKKGLKGRTHVLMPNREQYRTQLKRDRAQTMCC